MPEYESFNIPSDGNYIIRGEYEVNLLGIPPTAKGATLTIAKGAKVTVKGGFTNFGTINVLGTLILTDRQVNAGTIRVAGCGGGMFKYQQISNSGTGTIIKITEHNFENKVCTHCGKKGCETGQFEHDWDASTGICSFCGFACTHDWNATTGKCFICGIKCTNTFHEGVCPDCGMGAAVTGSILSEGSITIICSVACLAVGFLIAMFIFKKKKPALASGENTDEE